ncbi:MAG: hypothetical protein AAB906_00905 [Patescibacteria group bacterium]
MLRKQLLRKIDWWRGSDEGLIAWVRQRVSIHELNFVGVINGETAQLTLVEPSWMIISKARHHRFLVCTKRPGEEVRSVPLNTAYIVVMNNITREYEESGHQKPDRQRLVLVPVCELS